MDSDVFYELGRDYMIFTKDNIVFETVGIHIRYQVDRGSLPLGVQQISKISLSP